MKKYSFLTDSLEWSKPSTNYFVKTNILSYKIQVLASNNAIKYQYFNPITPVDFDIDIEEEATISTDYLKEEDEKNYSSYNLITNFFKNFNNFDFYNPQFNNVENPKYDKLYVFSDSLADPGNAFQATKSAQIFDRFLGLDIPVTPPSPLYFEGRFSNGLVWVEELANDLDIDLTPSTDLSVFSPKFPISSPLTFNFSNGINVEVSPYFNGKTTEQSVNFAFGGAKTGATGLEEFGDLIPGIQKQVEWFIEDHQLVNQQADSDALYILSGGSNDYADEIIPNPEDVVNNIGQEIQSLYDIGARDFLVSNLVDLNPFPETNSVPNLIQTHNAILEQTLDQLEGSLTGINIATLDFNFLFNDIVAKPDDYGLANVTDPYLDPITLTPTVGADPDEYLLFDTIHPTAAVHDIINDFALTTIAAEL